MAIEFEEHPIIIYGAARSGTSYLTYLINSHPEVFISDETRIFVWAHRIAHNLLDDEPTFHKMRDEFRSHLRLELPSLIRGFYEKMFPGRRYWGDKNPHYVADSNDGCLQTILDLFPNARFIHIIRDGRDVVCSALRHLSKDFNGMHQMWTSHINRGCAFGTRLPAERYFELKYEELVRDDLAMAHRLFAFLRIEMHPNVADYCRRQRERRMPLCHPTRDIVADVTRSDWGVFMDPHQQVRSLELLGPDLVRLGYESEASFRHAFQRAADQYVSYLFRPVQFEIQRSIPGDATVLVVSKGDDALLRLDGRTAWHFPRSENGDYAGCDPADSADAISRLESLRALGAEFLVLPRTQFWWLQHYGEFKTHLESNYRLAARRDNTCLIFDLRAQKS